MWNEAAHRDTIANGGTVREHGGENEDAAVAVVVRVAARGACEVKAPPRPHSSKCGPVAAAGAAPCWDACLTLDSLLRHNAGRLITDICENNFYLIENATSSRLFDNIVFISR